MPKNESVATAEVVAAPVTRKTYTNWEVFEQANIRLVNVVCKTNMLINKFSEGCNTRLRPDAKTMAEHVRAHGGGFLVEMAQATAGDPVDPVWKALQAEGLEIHNLTCDVCDNTDIRLTPQALLKHLRPHTNKNRRIEKGGRFYLTLGWGAPEDQNDRSAE